ncbi:hypothetical protein SUZIE_123805 [Sciurus carolinensis]|uniref:Uncharacterized protein n=1 Tax=Sciurus carolinensis TaxID=30640 RepID=A0AA41MKP1_SCICA|nr:hypothetical protein [Sciurus carolinensis]
MGPTWPSPPESLGRPSKLQSQQARDTWQHASAPDPPAWSVQLESGESTTQRLPLSQVFLPRPKSRSRCEEAGSLDLGPAANSLPPAPGSRAPTSSTCELKPQVRRTSSAGEKAFSHFPGLVSLHTPPSTVHSDPEPTPGSGLPPRTTAVPRSRAFLSPRVPISL